MTARSGATGSTVRSLHPDRSQFRLRHVTIHGHRVGYRMAGEGPAIVLVHGAFADGSGWANVIRLLEKDGSTVTAVQNPLTSLFDTPIEAAAWKTIPSWYLVATEDRAINPDLQRFMKHLK